MAENSIRLKLRLSVSFFSLQISIKCHAISSPSLSGSKARKIYSATKTWKYNKEEIPEMGLDFDNPAVMAVANVISAATNIPTDRVVMKLQNIPQVKWNSKSSIIFNELHDLYNSYITR